jgi:Cu-Zn family superoxide dismutase
LISAERRETVDGKRIRLVGAGKGPRLSGIGAIRMKILTRIAIGVGVLILSVGLVTERVTAMSQATPVADAIETPIVNADGETVGIVHAFETEIGVTFTVLLDAGALEPVEHGVHLHEVRSCDPSGETNFELAGDHFNLTESHHGAPGTEMSHAGDRGSLTVAEDGSAAFTISTDRVTLAVGEASPP